MSVKAAVLSDLHVGSPWAVWPPNFTRRSKVTYTASPEQLILLDYWEDFWGKAKDVTKIFLLGDLCQGMDRVGGGRLTITPSLHAQAEAAASLLSPHCKGRDTYVVSGSRYHSSIDMELDRYVSDLIGAKFCGVLKHGRIRGTDVVVQFAHGTAQAVIYRASMLDRESLFLDAKIGANKLPFVDLWMRGHSHYFNLLRTASPRTLFTVPCWQLWTPWLGNTAIYGRRVPDLGGVILEIEGKDIHVIECLYPYITAEEGIIDL